MKEYKNPEAEILKLTANDVLMTSGDIPPEIDPLENPHASPSVSLFG